MGEGDKAVKQPVIESRHCLQILRNAIILVVLALTLSGCIMPYLFSKPETTANLDTDGNWQPKKLADEKLSDEENADAINPETAEGRLYVEALSGKLPNGLRGEANGFYPVPTNKNTAVLFRPTGENFFVTKSGAEQFEKGEKISPENIIVVNDAGFNLGRSFERIAGKVSVTPLHFTLANFGYGLAGVAGTELVQYVVDQLGVDFTPLNPFYHLSKLFQKEPTAEELAEALEKADSATFVAIVKSFPAPFRDALEKLEEKEKRVELLSLYEDLAKNRPEEARAALTKLKKLNEKNPQNEIERVLALAELGLAQSGNTAAKAEISAGDTPDLKGFKLNTKTGGIAGSLSSRKTDKDGVSYDTGVHGTQFGVINGSRATGGSIYFDSNTGKRAGFGELGYLHLNRGDTFDDGHDTRVERPEANYFDAKGGLKLTLSTGTEITLAAGMYRLDLKEQDDKSGGVLTGKISQDIEKLIQGIKNSVLASPSVEASAYSGLIQTGDVSFRAVLGGEHGMPASVSLLRPGFFSIQPLAPLVRESNGKEIEEEIRETAAAYSAVMQTMKKEGRNEENLAALNEIFLRKNGLVRFEETTVSKNFKGDAEQCLEAREACPTLGEKLALRISDRFRALGNSWRRYAANEYGGFFPEVAKRLVEQINTEREKNKNYTSFENLVLSASVDNGMNNEVWGTATSIINPNNSTLTARVLGGPQNGTIVPLRVVGDQIRIDLGGTGAGVGNYIEIIQSDPSGTTKNLGKVIVQ